MLILQQLFNLSDEELEFQVNDRRSFEEFVGLGVMNNIPDATTIAFFRERLKETLENPGQLREHGSVIAGQDSVDGWQAARLL